MMNWQAVGNGLESDALGLIILLAIFVFLYMRLKHLTWKELWEKVKGGFGGG